MPKTEKVIPINRLVEQRKKLKSTGKTVVWTNGCFDVLHPGHVRSIQQAKAMGDILIVGLNSDSSIRKLKGADRPIFDETARVEMISALEDVDYIVVFQEETPVSMIQQIQPDIHCKGSDYKPPFGKKMPEAELVYSYGGRIEFLDLCHEYSTTKLIQKIGSLKDTDE